jgi:hypothetical protein
VTSSKPPSRLAVPSAARAPVIRCVIDGKALPSNAERRAGLCGYHLVTLAKP